MRILHTIAIVAGLAFPGASAAQTESPAQAAAIPTVPAENMDLDAFLWTARPVVVFADTPDDPRFVQQMRLLEERSAELAERDVVILTDTDPEAQGPLRRELRPRGFGLVLIDKDGSVAKRRPTPTSPRELINLIDRMPSRSQETGSRRY